MRRITLIAGPAAFAVSLFLSADTLGDVGVRVGGLAVWMALWWLSGVVPLEVTALLPIVILPLVDAGGVREITAAYASPIIFLFMGGFFIAATLERWGLHKRLAIAVLRAAGTDARRIVLAFLGIAAFASMWITNTATAVMLLPIATAVASGVDGEEHSGFPTALMLAVAYGASIGGVATLIGTPPNAILAALAPELVGHEVGFGSWMGFGLIISVPMLLVCWRVLVKLFRVSGAVQAANLLAAVGGESGHVQRGERFVVAVFVATALAWIVRAPKELGAVRIPGLTDLLPAASDAAIAIGASVILSVVPLRGARFKTALDWETASRIRWGILLLFGGGLALAGAFERSGLTEWIGGLIEGLRGVPFPIVLASCATLFVLLTELTSNTATAALGIPIMAGAAYGLGVPPLPLMVVTALSASMAFMLPVATPPNAIVFSSGMVKGSDMARAGIVLNVVAIAIITLAVAVLPFW